MPTITVQVTGEDIQNGQRRNAWTCPISLALWRATRQKWAVEAITCYPLTNPRAFVPLPAEVTSFISRFDATECGEPFEFKLELP